MGPDQTTALLPKADYDTFRENSTSLDSRENSGSRDSKSWDDLNPAERGNAVDMAVAHIEDAWRGEINDHVERPWLQRMYSNAEPMRALILGLFMALSFFEFPSWCYREEYCGEPDDVVVWGLPVLPVVATITCEMVFITVLLFDELCWSLCVGWKSFVKCRWHMATVALLGVAWFDVFVSCFNLSGIIPGHFRLATALRSLILMCKVRKIRTVFISVFSTVPFVFDVVAMLFFLIGWFGLLFFILFIDQPNEGWESVPEACMKLFILVTTANYPDVELGEHFEQYRYVLVLFIIFVCLGTFFLLNVVLASVAEGYKHPEKSYEEYTKLVRIASLKNAFKALDTAMEGHVDLKIMREVVESLNGYSQIPYLTEDEIDSMVESLDKDGDAQIDESEFLHFIKILHDTFAARGDMFGSTPVLSGIESVCFNRCLKCKAVRRLRRLRTVVRSTKFELFMILLTLLNTILILKDGRKDAVKDEFNGPDLFVEFSFTLFFVCEELLRIMVLGLRVHWMNTFNRFISLVVWTSLVLEIILVCEIGSIGPSIVRFVLLLRVLRLTRLLFMVSRFRVILRTTVDVLPEVTNLFLALLVFMFIYAHIGVASFGGQIRKSNEVLINNTPYADSNYWVENFNDFPCALNLLFTLLVVNNWMIFMDAFVVTSGTEWTRLYFISFYLVGVLIFLNVLVAFILEAYIENKDKAHAKVQARLREEENALDKRASMARRFTFKTTVNLLQAKRAAEKANMDEAMQNTAVAEQKH